MRRPIRLQIDGGEAFKANVKDMVSKSPSCIAFDFVNDSPEFLIADTIPDENVPFIVIWEHHNVSEIDNKVLSPPKGEEDLGRSHNLRGFFLLPDLKTNSEPFYETLEEVTREMNVKNNLQERAALVKKDNAYFQRGSKVILEDESGQLENLFGRPRFTALFIDKPMLQLMRQLTYTLENLQISITLLNRHYYREILDVKDTQGMIKDKFNETILEKLYKLMGTNPIRLEPILLTGNTGVGKTLIARWIHARADLKGGFQEINASGLSETLMETELFGYVSGAWTDAKKDKPGLAFLALGGVLFLDEIGDISINLQPRIMKFIEENTLRPDGWKMGYPIYSPLLVVAATNKDLEVEIKEGRFRQDFYARFRHRIHVPSIEERKESLGSIVDLILQNQTVHRDKIKYISHDAIKKLKSIHYEENFRGLERIVRNAAARSIDYGLDIILPECIEEQ